ncbi:amidase [Arthrobacter phage DrYang]|uniref:Protease n=1 Tax=Arthrobacter phage DrYang TaxID=2686080 RepID=A0A6B9JC39_9CAUD|nr:amidase [Arthrobacter phage DrYang]QGZ17203.1 protease [Arthrobacter phage DrYang]
MGILDKLKDWFNAPRIDNPESVNMHEAEEAMEQAALTEAPTERNRRLAYELTVAAFFKLWDGKDAPSEAFGPQSPALIQEFMQTFKPGWRWGAYNAADLADHPEDLAPFFFPVPVGSPLQMGDIVVFKADYMHPFGNVGIVANPDTSYGSVTVFTQHVTQGALRAQESLTISAVFRRNHVID